MTKSLRSKMSALCVTLVLLVLPFQAGGGGGTAGAAAADVAGAWNFVISTEGGERTSPATFKVDGKTVTGVWGEKTEVKGTFADNVLDLSFPFDSPEAGSGTLTIKATLANDELSGNWTFQQYGGTLKGTRAAGPAK